MARDHICTYRGKDFDFPLGTKGAMAYVFVFYLHSIGAS